jgi:hypothetical protein
MTLFTAYFDASGHPDASGKAPALFVSGFVAPVEKWRKFETRWLALLDEHHIVPPFHTTDFEAGQGQYAALRKNASACESFRAAAIDIMTRYTNKAFSVGVIIPDLRRLFVEYEVPSDLPRQPYPWCAIRVSDLVIRWAGNRVKAGTAQLTDNVQFIFQHGDKHQGEFGEAAKRLYGKVPLFLKDKDAVPFQACDYLAWEHRRWLSHRATHSTPKPRDSAVALARRLAFDSSLYSDWNTLRRHADENGWPKRKAS